MDRFYGTFTTLRADTLLENLRRRLLPLMGLCGDVALIGDPVAVWNWRIPGTYTMLNPHNIHASPVVRVFISLCHLTLTDTMASLICCWRLNPCEITSS